MSATRLAALLLLTCTAGCAQRLPATRSPGARASFEPSRGGAVLASAVSVLEEQGYAVESCDGDLAAVATTAIELDAPCGGTTCLARQVVRVKLGYRAARVTVRREVWDYTAKAWVEIRDADVRVVEDALLARLLARADDPAPGRAPGADPCRAPRAERVAARGP